MKKRSVISLAVAAFLAATVAVFVAPSAWAADRAEPNRNPGFLQVYDANVENLPTAKLTQCPGDWKDLVYYMRLRPYKPDVYLIQQISDGKQLKQLTTYLSKQLGETYKGVIAESSPKKMNSPCGPKKDYQTNAIIYRDARLTLDKHAVWQVQAEKNGECVNNKQARTKSVKALFQDKVSGKKVTVASVHWPTGKADGPPCATSNAKELNKRIAANGYGADLTIAGGDFNFSDRGGADWRGWYKSLNGDLGGKYGFRDAVFAKCEAADKATKKCLNDNWTIGGKKRIDFLFAKKPNGLPKITAAHTITFNEGDAADKKLTGGDRADRDYSQHRAITARVHY